MGCVGHSFALDGAYISLGVLEM